MASFNVLNLFNGNGTHQEGAAGGFPTARGANSLFEFDRQLAKEVSALRAINADVVGLMEIENDAGPNSALADLVAALNAAMGAGTYAYVDTGVIGTDEIKTALIYKPAKVRPAGAYRLLTSAVDPRFIDTRSRPVLAQTFELKQPRAGHRRRQSPQVKGLVVRRHRRSGHRRRPGQLQPDADQRRAGGGRLARG